MIVIIDYEVGNVGSVLNMIKKIGHDCIISNDKDDIMNATHLILPGVGSFDYGMNQLKKHGLIEVLQQAKNINKPILGICLGMQLLGKKSEEGSIEGLSFLDFEVVRFKSESLQIPHVGWNTLNIKMTGSLFSEINYSKFYFTHSYHIITNDSKTIIATTEYGYEFVSVVGSNNIFGVQFHPEKSHKYGMTLLKNFINVTK